LNEHESIPYILTIVDNASLDTTEQIAKQLCDEFPQLRYIRIEEKGVGIAFRKGINRNRSEIVGYMDVDLSTNMAHLSDMLRIFENQPKVDVVNASRMNRNSKIRGRKWYRLLTSYGLTLFMKLIVGMKATDAICGFKFFRKAAVDKLVTQSTNRENGWFYVIELLIHAEREMTVVELPITWTDDRNTTVAVKGTAINYLRGMFALRKKLKAESR
jgi:glycosyltransferase involved in cell wall biosynthesis